MLQPVSHCHRTRCSVKRNQPSLEEPLPVGVSLIPDCLKTRRRRCFRASCSITRKDFRPLQLKFRLAFHHVPSAFSQEISDAQISPRSCSGNDFNSLSMTLIVSLLVPSVGKEVPHRSFHLGLNLHRPGKHSSTSPKGDPTHVNVSLIAQSDFKRPSSESGGRNHNEETTFRMNSLHYTNGRF